MSGSPISISHFFLRCVPQTTLASVTRTGQAMTAASRRMWPLRPLRSSPCPPDPPPPWWRWGLCLLGRRRRGLWGPRPPCRTWRLHLSQVVLCVCIYYCDFGCLCVFTLGGRVHLFFICMPVCAFVCVCVCVKNLFWEEEIMEKIFIIIFVYGKS